MNIRVAKSSDLDGILPLVQSVWTSVKSSLDLYLQFSDMDSDSSVMFVAEEHNICIGFASVGLRFEYVEGTKTLPVAYLEGIAVKEEYSSKGVGKALINMCEQWARKHCFTEFASDCEVDNLSSEQFHKAIGFKEVSRNIHFVKPL